MTFYMQPSRLACHPLEKSEQAHMADTPKDPTEATTTINRDAAGLYDLDDRQDFADADRGLIARAAGPVLALPTGTSSSTADDFDYITDDADPPRTRSNPSLWRQSQLIKRGGLYKVIDGSTRSATTTSPT